MASPEILVHPGADELAVAAADRLTQKVVQAQTATGSASVVLTGGGVGTATLKALAEGPGRTAIDWSSIDLWWGDERFLPTGDLDRNDTAARTALLDHVGVDWSRVHPMAGPDGPDGDDPDAAAQRYAAQLQAAAQPGDPRGVPAFDVLLLGMGPEGHVASIFPSSPASRDERVVVAVRNCPKPPPTRISMTFPTLSCAREVWFLVAGQDKAEAVNLALSGTSPERLPAAGPQGTAATVWMLDAAAAADLPAAR